VRAVEEGAPVKWDQETCRGKGLPHIRKEGVFASKARNQTAGRKTRGTKKIV